MSSVSLWLWFWLGVGGADTEAFGAYVVILLEWVFRLPSRWTQTCLSHGTHDPPCNTL